MANKLSDADRDAALKRLTGWRYEPDGPAIRKVFKFKGFSEAFGFMAQVALAAQKADHHPDWSNSYNTVSITLSTHTAGGVTEKDIALAEAIEKIAG
jgi:4a-hydroxytetrahydrobiopterin dehydratase